MALEDEDLPPRKAPVGKKPLDGLSIDELEAYIAELEAEIARTRAAIAAKRAHRSGAEALFKK